MQKTKCKLWTRTNIAELEYPMSDIPSSPVPALTQIQASESEHEHEEEEEIAMDVDETPFHPPCHLRCRRARARVGARVGARAGTGTGTRVTHERRLYRRR